MKAFSFIIVKENLNATMPCHNGGNGVIVELGFTLLKHLRARVDWEKGNNFTKDDGLMMISRIERVCVCVKISIFIHSDEVDFPLKFLVIGCGVGTSLLVKWFGNLEPLSEAGLIIMGLLF